MISTAPTRTRKTKKSRGKPAHRVSPARVWNRTSGDLAAPLKRRESPRTSHGNSAPRLADRRAKVRVLWVRHCESCANVAATTEQKFMEQPLCTSRGEQQAAAVAHTILREGLAGRDGGPGVRFYCSILPRAMLTAAIAAEEMHKLTPDAADPPRVSVLHHVAELANSYERQLTKRRCTAKPTESVSTETTLSCWMREINARMRAMFSNLLTVLPRRRP